MRFIVAQSGARRGYAVPAILERAGMLERFYTDICSSAGFGKALRLPPSFPFIGTRLRGLRGRILPREIIPKTQTFDWNVLSAFVRRALAPGDPSSQFIQLCNSQKRIGEAIARAGFGNASHIYSMLGEFPPLLISAKQRGLTVVSEAYILLSTERILMEEQKQFPEWQTAPFDSRFLTRKIFGEDVLLKRTDLFICPSEAVRDDLVANHGVSRERTAIVPYGFNPDWLNVKSRPVPGRILFVGTAELRKGIHYLAMAANQLRQSDLCYDFRVAGNVSPSVRSQALCRNLNFLGRIPRDRIHGEFATADLFVLPSLAEGSAEATYEALAVGVPSVVTKTAGSVARDGIDGRVVPERDPTALATAIQEIVENRETRNRMARAARARAREYTWDRYGERLLAALRSFSR